MGETGIQPGNDHGGCNADPLTAPPKRGGRGSAPTLKSALLTPRTCFKSGSWVIGQTWHVGVRPLDDGGLWRSSLFMEPICTPL